MTQSVQIIGGITGCGEVIVINVDGLTLHLAGCAHHDVQNALLHKVLRNGVVLLGIQQDKTIGLATGNLRLDDAQGFF